MSHLLWEMWFSSSKTWVHLLPAFPGLEVCFWNGIWGYYAGMSLFKSNTRKVWVLLDFQFLPHNVNLFGAEELICHRTLITRNQWMMLAGIFLNELFKQKVIGGGSFTCWSVINRHGGFLLFQVLRACICICSIQQGLGWMTQSSCFAAKPCEMILQSHLLVMLVLLVSLKQWALNVVQPPGKKKIEGQGKLGNGLPFLPQNLTFSCMPSGNVYSSSSGLRLECQWSSICLSHSNSFVMEKPFSWQDKCHILPYTGFHISLSIYFLLHGIAGGPAFWKHWILIQFAYCF